MDLLYYDDMRNITGTVARGDDFFDRQSEIAQFWGALETDNLLLLAPRRVGKTSILRRMEETAELHEFDAVFRDVSDCADEEAFVRGLYETILESTLGSRFWSAIEKSPLGQLIGRAQKVGGYGFSVEFKSQISDWAQAGRQLADSLSRLEGNWLIQIDELPVFLLKLIQPGPSTNNPRIREFLYWMRRLRLDYPRIRWMLAGSIGLDTVTARINVSDAINDLHIVTVGAFDHDTANSFLRQLANNYQIDLNEEARQRVLNRIGWLAPYYLQLAFQQLRQSKKPSADEVDTAINRLLEPQFKTHFDYWRQRLLLELDPADAAHATSTLNTAAYDAQGATYSTLSAALASSIPDNRFREDRLRYLLDILVNDGYLVHHGHRYRFQFALLREFWLRRVAPPAGDSR